ncbi:MAG: RES domain-containing protein [Achromobacter sp.]|uniref:RES domain-containing protein n=1 Tax=Achromobacter sp. TaxID=134375 RepID=UPI003CFBD7D8
MTTLWRLSNRDALIGTAPLASRWTHAGAPVIVLDASPVAALLARLALVEVRRPDGLPQGYRLLEVQVPARCIATPEPPRFWQHDLGVTRAFGRKWLEQGPLLLRVPTMTGAPQFLLNCTHSDLSMCEIKEGEGHPFLGVLGAVESALTAGSDWLSHSQASEP